MKQAITTTYSFAPSASPGVSTLNLSGIANFNIALLYAVIDVTANQLVYMAGSPGSPGLGYSALSGTTLTLEAALPGCQASDALLIIYELTNADGGSLAHITNFPTSQSSGPGTDHSETPPSTLTQLASGTVAHPGQLYVMNQSAATIQLWLQGATVPILIDPGAGANRQGGDWSAMQNMPWFTGTFTINGASGAQIYANSN